MAKKHRYFVEWSAPNYHNAGNTTVMAENKKAAVERAKEKLGGKVKRQYLHHFDAWRADTVPSKAIPEGSITVRHGVVKRVGKKGKTL